MIMATIFLWIFFGALLGVGTAVYFIEQKEFSAESGTVVGILAGIFAPITALVWLFYAGALMSRFLAKGVRDLRRLWFPEKAELPKAKVVR